MNSTTILLSGVAGLVILSALCIFVMRYSFKNVFHAPRKTKEDAFELLEKRGVYDRSHYDTLNFEEMKIVSEDGYMLRGHYLNLCPEENKVVIFIHGYTANHFIGLQFAQMYQKMGYNMLLIDTRSHGESGAMYPTYGIKEVHDIKRWGNALRDKLGSSVKIALHGQSMGAATALMYIGESDDVAFVIADSPYSSAKEALAYQFKTRGHIPPGPVYSVISHLAEKKVGIILDDACPEHAIQKTTVPVLFVHGTRDKTIPSMMSEKMYTSRENASDKLVLIEGADHVEAYMVDTKTYEESIRDFIADK